MLDLNHSPGFRCQYANLYTSLPMRRLRHTDLAFTSIATVIWRCTFHVSSWYQTRSLADFHQTGTARPHPLPVFLSCLVNRADGEDRTPDFLLVRQALIPAELHRHVVRQKRFNGLLSLVLGAYYDRYPRAIKVAIFQNFPHFSSVPFCKPHASWSIRDLNP